MVTYLQWFLRILYRIRPPHFRVCNLFTVLTYMCRCPNPVVLRPQCVRESPAAHTRWFYLSLGTEPGNLLLFKLIPQDEENHFPNLRPFILGSYFPLLSDRQSVRCTKMWEMIASGTKINYWANQGTWMISRYQWVPNFTDQMSCRVKVRSLDAFNRTGDNGCMFPSAPWPNNRLGGG